MKTPPLAAAFRHSRWSSLIVGPASSTLPGESADCILLDWIMTTQEIRKLQEARPFHPFIIHTADGRRFPVRHPEFMASAPAARTLVVYQPNGSFDILDILLIATLEVRKNGATVKRKRHR